MGLFDFLKNKDKGIENSKFLSDNFQREILEKAIDIYFKNNHSYDAVKEELANNGLNLNQIEVIITKLKERKKEMVDEYQNQLDSGQITGIKIIPNVEHVKGNVDPDQVDKYIGFGAYQMDRGDFENALELFDKAIDLDVNATLAYANKGSLYSRQGDKETALVFYNKALSIEPNHIQILENKMDLLFEISNQKYDNQLLKTVKTILENNPVQPNALIYIIQFYLKENDLESSLNYAKKLFANFHRENVSTQLLLDIFHKLPTDRVLNEFSIFTKELKDDVKYQLEYCKGLYLMGIKAYEDSITTFENLNKQEEFSWNYYQISIIKILQNKTEESLKFLRKTLELEPTLKEDVMQLPYFYKLRTNIEFLRLLK